MSNILQALLEREQLGYLRKQKHPELDLYTWNYNEACQFEKKWDDYTMIARGLILDGEGNIVARAFDKFFNLGEAYVPNTDPETLEAIVAKHGSYRIQEKYDGSLGIIFWHNNQWHIATRGSFMSEQVIRAKAILKNFEHFDADKSLTHLFEIIYPENRIVVNYGAESKLVYLGSRNPITGEYYTDMWCVHHFEIVQEYTSMEAERKNAEGYVLVFDDEFRLKVKHEEYKRLHKLITGLNQKSIWEMLQDGKPLAELLVDVPDEFFVWVQEIAGQLQKKFVAIQQQCMRDYDTIIEQLPDDYIRKDFALKASTTQYPSIMFAMADSKQYAPIIWKIIKPKGDITYKQDES